MAMSQKLFIQPSKSDEWEMQTPSNMWASIDYKKRLHYAGQYKLSADMLWDMSVKENTNVYVLPMVFLYRHFLELTLKDVIQILRSKYGCAVLTEIELKAMGSHDFSRLLGVANPLFNHFYSSKQMEAVKEMRKILLDFQNADVEATAFRYDTLKNGVDSLPVGFVFNLKTFRDKIQFANNVLDFIYLDSMGSEKSFHD